MNVLVPVDAEEIRALAAAESVAKLPNAAETVTVTLLNVEEKIEVTGGEGGHVSSDEWYDEDELPPSVEAAKALLEREGITVEVRREHADPAETILAVADEIGADGIVMAGRKRTPVGKVLFGSVTQSVLLNADIPVTVVPVSPA